MRARIARYADSPEPSTRRPELSTGELTECSAAVSAEPCIWRTRRARRRRPAQNGEPGRRGRRAIFRSLTVIAPVTIGQLEAIVVSRFATCPRLPKLTSPTRSLHGGDLHVA